MNPKDALKPYIDASLRDGATLETIRQQLLDAGWQKDVVDDVLREYVPTTPEVNPPQPSSPNNQPSQPNGPSGSVATEKYGVIQAFKDAYAAIKNNPITIAVMMFFSYIAMVVVYVISVVFGNGILLVSFVAGFEENIFAQIILAAIATVLLMALLFTLATTFTYTAVGLAVNDGAEGKKSGVKTIALQGVNRLIRVLIAISLFNGILLVPPLVIATLGLVLFTLSPSLAFVAFLLVLVSIIAVLVLFLRYILIPIVALLEPDVPYRELLGRTRLLMKRGGDGFVIKCVVILAGVNILLSLFLPSHQNGDNPSVIMTITNALIGAVIYVFALAVFVVFYRNRKAVNG